MVKKKSKIKKFFYVQCGDWEGFTVAKTPRGACVNLVSQAIDLFKDKVKFTNVMICSDCDKMINDEFDDVSAFSIESILDEVHEY